MTPQRKTGAVSTEAHSMTSRKSAAAPILAALAIVLVSAAYVAGYFWLGRLWHIRYIDHSETRRVYPHRWQASIFRPAACIESKVRGRPIGIQSGEDFEE